MRRMDARRRKASALWLRFSQSLASRRTAVEPADCSLDNPALRQNDKTLGLIATAHDLGYQARHCYRQSVLEQRSGIGGVGKQLLEKREPREQGGQDHYPAIAILHIGRGYQRVQQQSHRID